MPACLLPSLVKQIPHVGVARSNVFAFFSDLKLPLFASELCKSVAGSGFGGLACAGLLALVLRCRATGGAATPQPKAFLSAAAGANLVIFVWASVLRETVYS